MPKKKEKEEVEESELEEELEEEPEIDVEKLNELLESQVKKEPEVVEETPIVRRGSPSLEKVEIARGPNFSLEQGVELETPSIGKKEDTKYETIKDPSEDYERNPNKKENIQYEGEPEAISASSNIDMTNVGRGPERMGQEFHMRTPDELGKTPESVRNYEAIQAKRSEEFKGEKTAFQEQMERKYERR